MVFIVAAVLFAPQAEAVLTAVQGAPKTHFPIGDGVSEVELELVSVLSQGFMLGVE